MDKPQDKLLSIAREKMTTFERQPGPGQVWKLGDEFLPFHPQASHVPPEYRDGWNRCYWMAMARAERIAAQKADADADAKDERASGNAVLVPADKLAELQKDAARYRWLRDRLLGADFDWNDSGECVLVFSWPKSVPVGGNCDMNIDAALEKEPQA
jgi:hypothetical protein